MATTTLFRSHLVAFFLNVFEQGDFWTPGLWDTGQSFLTAIGYQKPLDRLVTHTRNSIFNNYLFAKPNFWRRWLAIADKLIEEAESGSTLALSLNAVTSYLSSGKKAVPMKTFVQERIASLIACEGEFSVGSMDMTAIAKPSAPFFLQDLALREKLLACDQAKQRHCSTGVEAHLTEYRRIRATISTTL
jgi:hypothetical protein